MSKPFGILLAVSRLPLAALLLWAAFNWRTPYLASIRELLFAGLIGVSLALIALEVFVLRAAIARVTRILSLLSLVAVVLALTGTLAGQAHFLWMRHVVLTAPSDELAIIGQHILVGYRKPKALHDLIERRAIAGVFLSALNIRQKSVDDVAKEIAGWQDTRRQQGLPPLWISSDQEGGAVSRMSPPLPLQPSLASIVSANIDRTARDAAVRAYADTQAQGLHRLGVNLNLAPVVDVNHGVIKAEDKHSQIYRRAISTEPQVIADVAAIYCATLQANGVSCVLKHFPGLGRVANDTHVAHADLDTPMAMLAQTDWVPFRSLMDNKTPFVMLGHVRLTALDAEKPASFSAKVVTGLLRTAWGFRGVLITDDATMGAFYESRSGISGGALEALNAGVDLILISYDSDQYFTVMHSLLQALRDGSLRQDRLAESRARLAAAAGPP